MDPTWTIKVSAGGNFKIWVLIYFATWLSWAKNRVQDFKFGILPLVVLLAIIALILFKQPDTKSFILIAVTGISMLFISGVSMKYILVLGIASVVVSRVLVFVYPLSSRTSKNFH